MRGKACAAGGFKRAHGLALLLLVSLTVPAQATDDAFDILFESEAPTDPEATAQPYPDVIPVPAPEAQIASPAPARTSRLIEEIVVTAQKREENLQDVPITIQAFSAEALDARGILNPADLALVTPGLVYNTLAGYSLIYMRGVGTDIFGPHAEPSVATYVDGVYFPFSHGLAQDFLPIERIEVLKGPQGTLFGRNATGGALNIITKGPSDQWTGQVQVGIGSESARRAKGYVAAPLFGGLSFSLAGLSNFEEFYYDIAESSSLDRLPDSRAKGINPRLSWELNDRFNIMLSYIRTEFSGPQGVINSQTKPTPLGLLVGSRVTGPRETAHSEPSYIEAETEVVYGQIAMKPDWFDLKLIGSYQDVQTRQPWDFDNGPANAVTLYAPRQFMRSSSAELQLQSNATSAGADWLTWIVGVYYFESKGGFDPISATVFNLDAPGPLASLLRPLLNSLSELGFPSLSAGANLMLRGVIDTESIAGFAQATWHMTDWAGLTLGLRYQREEREMVKSSVGIALNADTGPEITAIDFTRNRDYVINNDDFSPRVAIDFKLLDDTLLYASWSQAFKSATFNIINITSPPATVEPEKVTAIEFGAKGSLSGGDFRYGIALFQNEIADLQTQIVSLASGGVIRLVNAAEATIRGAEFDTTWVMFPNALPGLVLTAGGAYLDGTYDNFPKGPGFDEVTGISFGPSAPLPARDFSGNQTVRVPEFSGNFGLSYTFDVPGGNLELGAEVYYNSGYFFDAQNTVEQPEHYLLNARVSYLLESWDLRLTAFGQNLTDQLYFQNIFPNDFGQAATGGPARTWGLGLTWTF